MITVKSARVDGRLVFKLDVPEGFEFAESPSVGLGLKASKDFRRGELVFSLPCQIMDDPIPGGSNTNVEIADLDKTYTLETNQGKIEVDVRVHTSVCAPGKRLFYTMDSQINHSCLPNLCMVVEELTTGNTVTHYYVTRDIKKGDWVCVDYDFEDWDNSVCPIEKCECQSGVHCRKQQKGFKFVNPEMQKRMLGRVTDHVRKFFLDENPTYFYANITPPKGLKLTGAVESCMCGLHSIKLALTADRAFAKGENIYSNTRVVLPDEKKHLIVAYDNPFLDSAHTDQDVVSLVISHEIGIPVHTSPTREFLGFDAFVQVSPQGNSKLTYDDAGNYTVIATRAISAGDRIIHCERSAPAPAPPPPPAAPGE
jgi:hypothetical protein